MTSAPTGRWSPPTLPRLGELTALKDVTILPVGDGEQRTDYELMIGYEVIDDSEVAARTELVVRYEVGGKIHEQRRPSRLVNCPPEMSQRTCDKKADELFPDGRGHRAAAHGLTTT